MYPWYQQAKQSIGGAIDVAAGEVTVEEMVFGDIRDKFLGPRVLLYQKRPEGLLQDDGIIFWNPTHLAGDYQTYMVKVMDQKITDMVLYRRF